ncbi:restriction endonuclease subunit S [Clostridium sp. UBA7503]|uniref:restriction endonuclease subunit S n=1 Tax=Clostridium sp. UBA7503 TaxID=1946377 RepID=UPI0032176F17
MSFSEWKESTLNDIADITMGQSPKGELCNNNGEGVPLLNGPTEFGEHHPYPTQFTVDVKKWARKGDLLFCVRGSTTGRMNWADRDYAIGRGIASISPKHDNTDRFIKCFIEIKLPELLKMATGSTFPNVSRSMLIDLCKQVPEYGEMIKINNFIRSIEDKIETNNQINKNIEEMAQAIFKQWFVDFEFPDEDGEPYKSSGGEMVESELGMIPKGWKIKNLGELCEIITKSEKPFENPEKIYEHFSLPACDEGKLPVIEMGKNISSNKYKINNDCILISKLNPSTKRIWGPLCNSENAICSTEFIVFKPYDTNIKPFCYEVINCDRFTEFLLANVTGSTGSRQRVQPKNTLNFKVLVSETNLIEDFCNVIKSIHEKIKLNIQEGKILKDTRDTLLPKLMSGEIRVPV